MILLTADDNGLELGLAFGVIFSIFLIFSSLVCIINVFIQKETDDKFKFLVGSIISLMLTFFVVQLPYTEYNLLYNYKWTDGKIIGRCKTGKGSRLYKFEYYVDKKRYTNCNSAQGYGIIKIGDIYKVRVSDAVPEIGRIDFGQPVHE